MCWLLSPLQLVEIITPSCVVRTPFQLRLPAAPVKVDTGPVVVRVVPAGSGSRTVTGLAFNAKGKRLAISHYGGATVRWTGKLDQRATKLEWRGSHIGITWSPDGTTVLTAMQERELHGWRLTDHQTMSMAGYGAKVRSMEWLRRPMILATSGGDCVTAWTFTGGGPIGSGLPLWPGRATAPA